MQVQLYDFSKKFNSTKQPAQTYVPVEITLKDNCSIANPVFTVSKDYYTVTYVYIPQFLRFYWVTEVIFISATIIEVHCAVDVLASFKTNIGNTTAYILRSSNSSAYTWGRQITDTYYPTLRGLYTKETFRLTPFSITSGWYCVGLINTGSTTTSFSNTICSRGSTVYVAMTNAQLTNLLFELANLTPDNADINPLSFIVSCVYIPDTYELTGTNTYSVRYAGETFSLTYSNDPYDNDGVGTLALGNLTVPENTFVDRGSYMNFSPYFTLRVFSGVFGVFDIPLDEFTNSDRKLGWNIELDLPTGKGTLKFYNGTFPIYKSTAPTPIQYVSGQVGVPIQISQITTTTKSDIQNTLGKVSSSFGAAISGKLIPALTGLADATISSWQGSLPTIQSNGTNGSLLDLSQDIWIVVYEATPAEENLEDIGRPVYKRFKISTIAGYIQCNDAEISVSATRDEIAQITNYMNTGFFYE